MERRRRIRWLFKIKRTFRERSPLIYNYYPAAQPVMMESRWFIFFSPDNPRKVLPQKSFEALQRGRSESAKHRGKLIAHNFVARFGASSNNGGTRPEYHHSNHVSCSNPDVMCGRAKAGPRYNRPNLRNKCIRHEKRHKGSTVHAPFLSDDGPEASH
jgi:hypothetical protein